MVRRQLVDRLLQEVDIALQAGGAPLHRLFDGADLDAGNVLRMNGRRPCRRQQRKREGDPGHRSNHQKSSIQSIHRTAKSITAICTKQNPHRSDTILIPHSGVVLHPVKGGWILPRTSSQRLPAAAVEIDCMATREKRLAQFDGNGDPPPDQPVEVLCEDHSGTYQLPFACRWIDGQWRNDRTGGMVEATVVAWRLPRSSAM